MATIEDVVSILVERTASGELEWSPQRIVDGYPEYWSIEVGGCLFAVHDDEALRVMLPHSRGEETQIGSGEAVGPLLAVVREKDITRPIGEDEALQAALECLKEPKRAGQGSK